MKKQVNRAKRDTASQGPQSRDSRPPSETHNRLLDSASVQRVYVIDLETARRLGDLDYHMCWPYSAE